MKKLKINNPSRPPCTLWLRYYIVGRKCHFSNAEYRTNQARSSTRRTTLKLILQSSGNLPLNESLSAAWAPPFPFGLVSPGFDVFIVKECFHRIAIGKPQGVHHAAAVAGYHEKVKYAHEHGQPLSGCRGGCSTTYTHPFTYTTFIACLTTSNIGSLVYIMYTTYYEYNVFLPSSRLNYVIVARDWRHYIIYPKYWLCSSLL